MTTGKIPSYKTNTNEDYVSSTRKSRHSVKTPVVKPKRDCLSIYDVPFRKLGSFTYIPSHKSITKKLSKIPTADLNDDVFFIRMESYPKDEIWARRMCDLTYKTSYLINMGYDFDEILNYIRKNTARINGSDIYGSEKQFTSKFDIKQNGRGSEYFDKYKEKICNYLMETNTDYFCPKGNENEVNTNICKISYFAQTKNKPETIRILYGRNFKAGRSNMELVKKEYQKLKKNKKPSKDKINASIAKIHWLIAQESPYCKGNDSIANILTKAIYTAYGYKTSRIKAGKSFDFEAFYRNLDDYIKVYPSLFEQEPYKI